MFVAGDIFCRMDTFLVLRGTQRLSNKPVFLQGTLTFFLKWYVCQRTLFWLSRYIESFKNNLFCKVLWIFCRKSIFLFCELHKVFKKTSKSRVPCEKTHFCWKSLCSSQNQESKNMSFDQKISEYLAKKRSCM